VAKKQPVSIIVRRGATRRFDSLKKNTANMPVVVSWDRRSEDRRETHQPASAERRSTDRRKTPPFTWEAADFVVVDAHQPDATDAPRDKELAGAANSTAGQPSPKRGPKKAR
jgi:hypothetical protein